MKLENKVALVTGSAKGIGRAIAIALAKEGCNVIINDVDVEPMESVVQEIKKMGRQSMQIVADVRNPRQINEMVDKCVEVFGKIDILVNNAGGSVPPDKTSVKLIGDVTEDLFDWVIDTNLKGTFFCTQAALRYMKEQKGGKIVNISSVAGRAGDLVTNPSYSAAKAGVLGLTRHVAKEVGCYGISINSICPGLIMSGPRVEKVLEGTAESGKAADKMLKLIALGRIGRVEEIASVVVFLCSNEASYITGATIDVNGGYVTL